MTSDYKPTDVPSALHVEKQRLADKKFYEEWYFEYTRLKGEGGLNETESTDQVKETTVSGKDVETKEEDRAA